MSEQSELELENELVIQLVAQGFTQAAIANRQQMLANLRAQLSTLNAKSLKHSALSDNEFKQVLNALGRGNVFEKAATLRDRLKITRDDNSVSYLTLLSDNVSDNSYQVTHQVTVQGAKNNRYDVTLLVNGLPLIQIELKRRGLAIKEAFNQINRYQRDSYWAEDGLFNFVQIFVISNGVNTKYYANNYNQSFEQTFFWSAIDNKNYTRLNKFAEVFFTPSHITTMISQYIVLNETDKILMVMRPYQIYATEAIINRISERQTALSEGQPADKFNGYIWHATGSGKTLTSFKTAQLLTQNPTIDRVVFVVDRRDLDYQTAKEFNGFAKGCVDGTDKTKVLVKQFLGKQVLYAEDDEGERKSTSAAKGGKVNIRRNEKLIVTTIQKLNYAIKTKTHKANMETVRDQHIVFIFDECHRSQFGETHQRISEFFTNHQMFGFTGTPILKKNALTVKSRKFTTKNLFHESLHKYTIVDAIRDKNVLKFGVEYIGRYKRSDTATEIDIEVENIDTKELMEADKRLDKITDYIIAQHNRKTHGKTFTAMFCVSSIAVLIRYYELLRQKKLEGRHNLKIATIFSTADNEEDPNADGDDSELKTVVPQDYVKTTKLNLEDNTIAETQGDYMLNSDKLELFIGEYNKQFGCKYTSQDSKSFYNYYNDISRRVKNREIDILLVVNMFLTGFDSKSLNTLYVDKNLKFHGLIQAYSRTNRILNAKKKQGNIVCFRNLKDNTDKALGLYSDKDAQDEIFMPPFEEFLAQFKQALEKLQAIAPDADSVDDLQDEQAQLAFINAFREVMRLRNILSTFADFDIEQTPISDQDFADYTGKYKDLYDEVKSDNEREKTSVLDEVDFEVELIAYDEINVAYIMQLLGKLKESENDEQYQFQYKSLMQSISNDPIMRSKQELIEQFIQKHLPNVESVVEVESAFEAYWEIEKANATSKLALEENIIPERIKELVSKMVEYNREPTTDDIIDARIEKPSLLQRKSIAKKVTDKLKGLVNKYYLGM